MRTITIVLALGLGLTPACATKSGTGTAVGAVGGGVIGGVLGGGTGMLIGAAAGGLLGYGAGRAAEEQDRREIAASLEANEAMRWRSDRGYYYEVQPTRTFQQGNVPCRDFRMTANIDTGPREVHGTACRQSDGSWQIVSG